MHGQAAGALQHRPPGPVQGAYSASGGTGVASLMRLSGRLTVYRSVPPRGTKAL